MVPIVHGNADMLIIERRANGWTVTVVRAPPKALHERVAQAVNAAPWIDKTDVAERMLDMQQKMLEVMQREPLHIPSPPQPATFVAKEIEEVLGIVSSEMDAMKAGDTVDKQLRAILGGASS